MSSSPASGPRPRDRDSSVQLDDRRVREARELAVEGGDLGPVARLLSRAATRLRLHDVGATTVQRKGRSRHVAALVDLCSVPTTSVLVGEEHEVAVPDARFAAGVEQQHHREQAVHLRLVGHQLGRVARPSQSASLASSSRPPSRR